jgi:hypothetical protein
MAQLAALQGQAGGLDLSQLQLQMGAGGELQLLHTAPGTEHHDPAAAAVAVSHGLLADPHAAALHAAGMGDPHQVMAASAGMQVATAGGELLGLEMHPTPEQEAAAHAAAAAAHGMTPEQWHAAYAAALQQQQQQQQHHELHVGDLSALDPSAAVAGGGGGGELVGVVGDLGAAADAAAPALQAVEGGAPVAGMEAGHPAAVDGAAPVLAAGTGEEAAAGGVTLDGLGDMQQMGAEVQGE